MRYGVKLLFAILLASLTLLAERAPTVAELVNQLKQKSGQTLKNPVLFVKYGPKAFDWLLVTADGKLAAKLNGVDKNGYFQYTIIHNPAQYGLRFDVSLQGVTIHSTATSSQQKEVAIKTANTTIKTIITGVAPQLGSKLSGAVTRDLAQNSLGNLFIYPVTRILFEHRYIRQTATQPCAGGGSLTIEAATSNTATVHYNQCTIRDVLFNGSITLHIQDQSTLSATYSNFSISDERFTASFPLAHLTMHLDVLQKLKDYTFSAQNITIEDKKKSIAYSLKNFSQKVQLNGHIVYVTTNTLFKASCQSEWTTIKTLSPIRTELTHTCPTAGVIEATNKKAHIKVVINPDESIDVYELPNNRPIKHYTNCHEISDEEICSH